ncbi:sigma factor-like helix-turn-helix DNA-binding protein [Bacillus sp. P14.5]|uniref:sigma factor-like helix-turn-helix DNA-binding protein n=1 Tax=Bacillus sp. P14.5 TaxID=1983400 RepID=UPI001F06D69C|nr:sigma factor-like helix-turn-helix DNA-binding protein [Bacillus sp. P14.5]
MRKIFFGKMEESMEYDSLIEILFSVLPLQQAMLITLKDVFGYTMKELSIMLRTSEESIKTSLHRSRKRLNTTAVESLSCDMTNNKVLYEISQAIKEPHPMKLFLYYRVLSSRNFHVKKKDSSSFHAVDPDGNVLEITS